MTCVLRVTPLEKCLDSTLVVQIDLDEPLDEPCMRRIAALGRLTFCPDFPRPYFCVRAAGRFVAQGILGDCWIRVTFLPRAPHDAQHTLADAIAGTKSLVTSASPSLSHEDA